jgi:hypothetical protein
LWSSCSSGSWGSVPEALASDRNLRVSPASSGRRSPPVRILEHSLIHGCLSGRGRSDDEVRMDHFDSCCLQPSDDTRAPLVDCLRLSLRLDSSRACVGPIRIPSLVCISSNRLIRVAPSSPNPAKLALSLVALRCILGLLAGDRFPNLNESCPWSSPFRVDPD